MKASVAAEERSRTTNFVSTQFLSSLSMNVFIVASESLLLMILVRLTHIFLLIICILNFSNASARFCYKENIIFNKFFDMILTNIETIVMIISVYMD